MATKPIDTMSDAELRRYIEQRMAELPADVRDSVVAEYAATLGSPRGAVHGGAHADGGAVVGGDREPSMAEPASDPHHDAASASHSPDAADAGLDRALALLARNVERNRETDAQWRRRHGLRTGPDPDSQNTDEQILRGLRQQARRSNSRSHATYEALQSDRRRYLP
jgi:hypothetical protein